MSLITLTIFQSASNGFKSPRRGRCHRQTRLTRACLRLHVRHASTPSLRLYVRHLPGVWLHVNCGSESLSSDCPPCSLRAWRILNVAHIFALYIAQKIVFSQGRLQSTTPETASATPRADCRSFGRALTAHHFWLTLCRPRSRRNLTRGCWLSGMTWESTRPLSRRRSGRDRQFPQDMPQALVTTGGGHRAGRPGSSARRCGSPRR
ncbi:hypothetical protein B0H14DRAFT_2915422 [Mycena olivaceomarginata]|nr:hypothetical protein B0H14DRAFT_2915422 [Mycena olivaceomarginata]